MSRDRLLGLMGILLCLACAFPVHAETTAHWIALTDKGPGSYSATERLDRARELPIGAWARRMRTDGEALPDELDRPLHEPYVAEIAQHASLRHRSRWINAVSVNAEAEALEAIAALPFVRAIWPVATADPASLGPAFDDAGRPLGVVTHPEARAALIDPPRETLLYGPSQGQLEEIGVPPVHALGFSGNRVIMMMIDTGFRKDHDAFAGTDLLGEWDFIFGDGNVQNEPEDDENQHNHGTATWGAAGGYAPGHLIGPGYGASFYLAKTEDIRTETQVEEDYYVAALEWADSAGVQVTSASLNYICFDDLFCYEFEDKDGDTAVITIAIDIAAARGILCVNSQGNYGCDIGSLGTPADADSMLAVGAVDSLNVIASFSACGPTYDGRIKPEVVARGREVYWTSADSTNTYGHSSGTSCSAPQVGGTCALLLEAHPEWSNMDVHAALLATADRAASPDNTYGWGRISAINALTYTPLIYPVPFSLLTPEDGSTLTTVVPTFTWRASEDPDIDNPLSYTVRIEEAGAPGSGWLVDAGSDTTLTLPFQLAPDTEYVWEVIAADSDENERLSRETFGFATPSVLASPEPPPAYAHLKLTCWPNPAVDRLHFRVDAPGADALAWTLRDPLGRSVARGRVAGTAEVTWSPDTPPPAGVYYLEVRAGAAYARETVLLIGE